SFSPPSCCLFSLLLLLSDCSRARWRLPSFPTRRSSDLDMRGGAALLRHLPLDVPDAVGDGLGVQDHPAAAPVGVVVGLLLAVEGVIPDLVAVGLDVPPPGGPAQDALVQHPLAHLREQGRNVHTHPHQPSSRSLTPPSSSRPGMGVTVM